MLRVGDLLEAEGYCYPDNLTPHKKYVVTKIEECPEGVGGGVMFWVIDDLGQESMPKSTVFHRINV